jgi:arginyl-tRNA synthetase
MMDKLSNYLIDAAQEFHYIYVDCAASSKNEDNTDPDLNVKTSSWESLKNGL